MVRVMLCDDAIRIENFAVGLGMKTVIRDIKTGLLFRNMDEWTSHIGEAAAFRDALTALKFCHRHNLSGVSVVQILGTAERTVGFHRRTRGPLPSEGPVPSGQSAS